MVALRLKNNCRNKDLGAVSGVHPFLLLWYLTYFLLTIVHEKRVALIVPYLGFDGYICFLEVNETDLNLNKRLIIELPGVHRLVS